MKGPFICRIRVLNIGNSYSGWNFGFGVIRASSTRQTDYYYDCALVHADGCISTKYTGSGNSTKVLEKRMENNDELIIKRDDKNNILFALNDENKLNVGHSDVGGDYKIVAGFSSSLKNLNDTFEMVELENLWQ